MIPIGPRGAGADRADSARRLAARMRAEPGAAYPLDALAAEAGHSRFQLLRAFRAALGVTPHAYLLAQRVAAARGLLASGAPPAEVAAACGFSDQPHLTAAFRRLTGETPAQFARGAAARRRACAGPCEERRPQ